ncbi:terpenoid synthase [Macrolepiota fuliginosa MF-IS2]|uniref:Terpenoid synthase n=1 Tax=Macrolepiota fuliginosa MF-IS2 TaxID=1400762 RepID=A0A9P5XJ78_9AGAR|nr:terpenoid synthase [Macrolepiota fuliginosa MF-IS2]
MHIRITSSLRLTPKIWSATRSRIRKYSALAQKIEHGTLPEPISIPHEQLIPRRLNPFTLVAPELNHLRSCLISLLGSAHPGLTEIAEYYFLDPRKQLRSSTVFLIAKATNGLGKGWQNKQWTAAHEVTSGLGEQLDRPLQLPDVLYECNPSMADDTASFADVFRLQRPTIHQLTPPRPPSPLEYSISSGVVSPPLLLPTQIRLAQIVEMIHVASLLHDHINSSSDADSGHHEGINNKLAILGGDFLLGRASTALSQLGESEVVELIASVISNQVEGEILRMDKVQTPTLGLVEGPSSLDEAWDMYLRQTYLKTASLMAKSARGAVVLGGSRDEKIWKDVAYAYGRSLGIAHQLAEDASALEVGLSDLRPGLATAPTLFAWEEHPELRPYIRRNFSVKGDLEAAVDYVSRSSGVERTRSLAHAYAQKARDSLHVLPESDARLGLEALASAVVN